MLTRSIASCVLMVLMVLMAFAVRGSSTIAAEGNWPRFQGPPAGESIGEQRPINWSPDENICWRAEPAGYGQSSPVIWNGRVYVTSVSGAMKEKCHVAAFDLASGRSVWQRDFDSASQTENTGYVSKAATSPVADENGLIAFFESGDLIALTHEGRTRWRRNLVKEFGLIDARHGLGGSLEQTDSIMFVWVERQTDPYILAVNKKSGGDVWKADGVGSTSWSSPRLVPVGDGQHLVLSAIGSLIGLDPATGDRLWRLDDIAGNSTPTPIPVGEGRFLIGATVGRGDSQSGRAAESNGLVEITRPPEGGFQADFVWRAERATCSFGSPIAHRGNAYYVNAAGVLFCLDLETGKQHYAERIGESVWATPLAAGDRIYFFGKSGTTTVVAAKPQFEKLAENRLWEESPSSAASPPMFGGPVLYAAAATGGRLVLRSGEVLYCVGQPQ